MSLINDALKRATQAPSAATGPAPEPNSPMQPVDYRRTSLPWYFFPSLLLILAGACWFIVKGLDSSRAPGLTVHAREPQPATDTASGPNSDPTADLVAAGFPTAPADNSYTPTQLPHRNFSLEDSPAVAPATDTPAPPAAVPESPKPSSFKLQGIFFRATNPSATVNGKNVTVGSRINGATVTSITRDGVTLDAEGQTTVLTLE
jgi:hypothetical protein